MSDETLQSSEQRPEKTKIDEIGDKLTRFPLQKQIRIMDAALTICSRYIVNECILNEKDHSKSEDVLNQLKELYLTLAAKVADYGYHQPVETPPQLSKEDIQIFFSKLSKIIPSKNLDQFYDFPFNPNLLDDMEPITVSVGTLNYVTSNNGRETNFYLERIKPQLDEIKKLYQEGKIKWFFGNSALGNYEAALLVKVCQAEKDRFRIYRCSSHKAKKMFGVVRNKFEIPESELKKIDTEKDGICIVDGFCDQGTSVKESILGFRRLGFKGPIFIFIGGGSYPKLIDYNNKGEISVKIEVETRAREKEERSLWGGWPLSGPILLEVTGIQEQ